jgi:hypothetical protein
MPQGWLAAVAGTLARVGSAQGLFLTHGCGNVPSLPVRLPLWLARVPCGARMRFGGAVFPRRR